ncbi:MAG: CoA-binding protein, partial [Gammaproteobacteria bacterium]
MPHRLETLLRPESIAVVGASRRKGTVGNTVVRNLLAGGYGGRLYALNPGYTDIEGVACFSELSALPEQVEQVIFAVGDERLEQALHEAVLHGAKSCVIYSSLVLAADSDPPLKQRILRKIRDAKLLVCGGNAMGYYNFRDRIWACGFDTRGHRAHGNVTLISQSGSGMSAILDVEERIDFNLAVSTGQELSVTLEDYLDYVVEQSETKVIGLFLETSRDPQRFISALAKAA